MNSMKSLSIGCGDFWRRLLRGGLKRDFQSPALELKWSAPLDQSPARHRRYQKCSASGRSEDPLGWPGRRRLTGPRRSRERGILLEHQHDTIGEEAHVELGLVVRHAAKGELGDQVVERSEPPELRE